MKFRDPYEEAFANIVGKGENAGKQHFLLFSQCLNCFEKKLHGLDLHLICRLQMLLVRILILVPNALAEGSFI